MKIIHTSDWHLGHQLYNYDREEEQLNMLEQIQQLVSDEQPDALLISGDVYHTAQPSAAVQKMFTDALVKMHRKYENTKLKEEVSTLKKNQKNKDRSAGSRKTAGASTPKDPFDDGWDF